MSEQQPQILIEEIDNQMRRLKDQAVVDYKKELLANCYPILRMLAEQTVEQRGRIEVAEAAIAEALTQMESQLLPELSAALQMTLALGVKVCQDTRNLFEPGGPYSEDDLSPELRATIDAFERAAGQVSQDVAEVTLEAIDEDDLDADDEDDLDADDDKIWSDALPQKPPPPNGGSADAAIDAALEEK
jgi:hypothetical protein